MDLSTYRIHTVGGGSNEDLINARSTKNSQNHGNAFVTANSNVELAVIHIANNSEPSFNFQLVGIGVPLQISDRAPKGILISVQQDTFRIIVSSTAVRLQGPNVFACDLLQIEHSKDLQVFFVKFLFFIKIQDFLLIRIQIN
jgi:hypothetical protein